MSCTAVEWFTPIDRSGSSCVWRERERVGGKKRHRRTCGDLDLTSSYYEGSTTRAISGGGRRARRETAGAAAAATADQRSRQLPAALVGRRPPRHRVANAGIG